MEVRVFPEVPNNKHEENMTTDYKSIIPDDCTAEDLLNARILFPNRLEVLVTGERTRGHCIEKVIARLNTLKERYPEKQLYLEVKEGSKISLFNNFGDEPV